MLYYAYYDCPGKETAVHSAEISRFIGRVGKDIRFRSMTYQDLFERRALSAKQDTEYLEYLRARYFEAVA